ARVFEHGMNYVCEKSVGPEKSCDFRTGKMILQQEVSPEQVRKLLSEGKTDLLDGFVSSRTNRKFKAFLVKQANGKVGFEFEARAPGKGGAAKKAAGKKTASKTASKTAAKTATKAATKTAAKKTAAKKAAGKAAAKKTTAKKAATKKTAAKKAGSPSDDAPF
ncbi:MAG: topoisomerase C-terminal repeat-containing protein, partial [Pusillimonas sp.]|nr:topoisomerase C-terminal repeat-containing protein [Pusillimonas sp.]